MTYYAPIVPHWMLQNPAIRYRKYHMVLASLLDINEEYKEAYMRLRAEVEDAYIIMDNGVWEDGKALTNHRLIEHAIAIGADEIILPDAIKDARTTVELIQNSIPDILTALPNVSIGAVVQGRDAYELLSCYTHLINLPYIDCLYLPKSIEKIWPRGRAGFIHANQPMGQDFEGEIHLLGVNQSLMEISMCADLTHIRSFDATYPVLMGLGYMQLSMWLMIHEVGIKPKRPENYFRLKAGDLNYSQYRIVVSNVGFTDEFVKHYVRNGQD